MRKIMNTVVGKIAEPFRIRYVIDYRQAEGYLFRAPMFVTAAFCWMVAVQARNDSRVTIRTWDHVPTPEGL